MPPGFLLRVSTMSTSIATTTHHLILVLGLSLTEVLSIPHQQVPLSLEKDLELGLWLCQSAVAHLLRVEDGEQLKAGQLSPRSDDCSMHRRRCCGGGASVV